MSVYRNIDTVNYRHETLHGFPYFQGFSHFWAKMKNSGHDLKDSKFAEKTGGKNMMGYLQGF